MCHTFGSILLGSHNENLNTRVYHSSVYFLPLQSIVRIHFSKSRLPHLPLSLPVAYCKVLHLRVSLSALTASTPACHLTSTTSLPLVYPSLPVLHRVRTPSFTSFPAPEFHFQFSPIFPHLSSLTTPPVSCSSDSYQFTTHLELDLQFLLNTTTIPYMTPPPYTGILLPNSTLPFIPVYSH